MHKIASTINDFPPFSARFPWLGGDLQTLASTLWPFLVPQCDGGESLLCSLDRNGQECLMTCYNPVSKLSGDVDMPLVVLLHGLGGDETSSYMRAAAHYFGTLGYPVLRVNLRGSQYSAPTSVGIYHAGLSSDIEKLIRFMPENLKRAGLVLVGFSLGANVLLKYLGEAQPQCVKAAVAVSPPFDLYQTQERLNEPRNRVYRYYLVHKLKRDYHAIHWGESQPPVTNISRLTSIIEFDESVIAPVYGFKNAMDYYQQCSASGFIDHISVSTLIIQAADDPWIPKEIFLERDWRANPAVTFIMTASGGHVGFHSKESAIPWHLRAAARFIA